MKAFDGLLSRALLYVLCRALRPLAAPGQRPRDGVLLPVVRAAVAARKLAELPEVVWSTLHPIGPQGHGCDLDAVVLCSICERSAMGLLLVRGRLGGLAGPARAVVVLAGGCVCRAGPHGRRLARHFYVAPVLRVTGEPSRVVELALGSCVARLRMWTGWPAFQCSAPETPCAVGLAGSIPCLARIGAVVPCASVSGIHVGRRPFSVGERVTCSRLVWFLKRS